MASGTSFQIDIAAQMTGADVTTSQLRELEAKLTGSSATLAGFDDAIDQTKSALKAAQAATAANASALAMGETKYKQLEVAADRAQKAVEKAYLSGKGVDEAATAADDAAAAVMAQAVAVDALRAKATEAATAQLQLAGTLKNLEAAAKAAGVAEREAEKAAAADAGKQAAAEKAAAKEHEAEAARAAAKAERDAASAAAALAAADKAAAKEADALTKAQEKGAQAAAGASKGAKQSAASLEETTALAKGALGPMGGLFEKVTLVGKGLSKGGLAGYAILAAVGFVMLGTAIFAATAQLAMFAVTSNKKAMERLTKATDKAKENFAKLFSGVHVDKFVAAVEKVLSIFDESTNEAMALKAIISALLNPLFDQSGALVPITRELFRGMVMGALDTAIAVVRLRNALDGMLPDALQGQVDWLKTAFEAGRWAVYGVVFAMVALAAVVGIVAGVLAWVAITIAATTAALVILAVVGLALVLWPFILLAVVIAAAILYFDEIKAAVLDFGAAAASAAGSLINGLVGGISSGAGMVYDAIRNLAEGAIGTLKKTLGIASPSKVFALAGSYTAEGFAEGVEGNDAPQSAVDGMVQAPAPGSAGASGSTAGGASRTIDLRGAQFHFHGEESKSRFEDWWTNMLEGNLLQLGGAEPEPA